MKPILGIIAAAGAIVLAIVAVTEIEIERDGDIHISNGTDGPAERVGEEIDEAVEAVRDEAQN